MTRSNTLAVARAKLGSRNRAIVKRLAAGASPRAAPWSANRVARLRLLWRRGLSTVEIGRLLGVSKSAIVGKIGRLELPPPSAELQARKRRRPSFWTANRIANLRKLWGTLSNAAIARELGISKAAVFRQARRLALPPRRLNAWPRSRVATLRALWRRGLSMAAIGRQLGVSGSRVFAKVPELGFPPRSRPHATWHTDRIGTLRRKGLSLAAIGQRLGVSKRAVECKIRRLKSQSPQV